MTNKIPHSESPVPRIRAIDLAEKSSEMVDNQFNVPLIKGAESQTLGEIYRYATMRVDPTRRDGALETACIELGDAISGHLRDCGYHE